MIGFGRLTEAGAFLRVLLFQHVLAVHQSCLESENDYLVRFKRGGIPAYLMG